MRCLKDMKVKQTNNVVHQYGNCKVSYLDVSVTSTVAAAVDAET